MTPIVREARTWCYNFGAVTIQRCEGEEIVSAVRWLPGGPQMWWNIPKHPAYAGMVERVYARMVEDEDRCHSSHNKPGPTPAFRGMDDGLSGGMDGHT